MAATKVDQDLNVQFLHKSGEEDHQFEKPLPMADSAIYGHDFSIDQEELPKGYFRSPRFLGSMFAIGLSFACGTGGFAFAAPILGYIDADIGPDPNLTWVALTYTLTTAIGLLIVGRVTDIFGRRWWMIGGSATALLGCIVCATAQNINAMIAGETLIGLGGSTQLSMTFTQNELVPIKYRFNFFASIYIFGLAGTGFAPVIAYAFVFHTSAGWRGVFYLLIAMNATATLAWFLFYHPPNFHMKHGHGKKLKFIKQFDYLGLLLVVLGLLLFLMGLSWGGSLYPWKSAHVISCMVVGFLLLVSFLLFEIYVPMEEPLLPVHLFKNRGLMVSIVLQSIGASVYYAFAIVWPSMVVTLYADVHTDPMWPGYAALALNGGITFGELVGACQRRYISLKLRFVFAAGGALLAATASCTADTPGRAIALMAVGSMFIGGVEIFSGVAQSIFVVDQREIGTAVGFGGSMRSFISTVCATVYTVILSNRLKQTIPAQVPPALIEAGLPATSIPQYFAALAIGTPTAFSQVPGITALILAAGQAAYKHANADAYKTVFLSTIAFSATGLIISFFLPDMDPLLTAKVSATLHEVGKEEQVQAETVVSDAKV